MLYLPFKTSLNEKYSSKLIKAFVKVSKNSYHLGGVVCTHPFQIVLS